MPDGFSPEQSTPNSENSFASSSELIELLRHEPSIAKSKEVETRLQLQRERVLSLLPPDFLGHMHQHLLEGQKNAKRFGREFNPYTYSFGEVFEVLVEIEEENFDLFPNTEKFPQTEEDKIAAKKLLDVMQNPLNYGLVERSICNPDIVRLKLRNGTYVIEEIIEAKTNTDARTERQFSKQGFLDSFQKMIKEINSMENPEDFNLGEFAAYGLNIGVALDYVQKLILPQDPSVDYSDPEVTVSRSAFRKRDIAALTQWVLDKIAESDQVLAQA